MKIFLSLAVIMCLGLNSGMGAPAKGRYMFVKCNPRGNNANCQIHRSPQMTLRAELPAKLPASLTRYLDAKLVKEKGPVTVEEETAMFLPEDGSGGFEGSATVMADGSGEYWTGVEAPQAGKAKAEYQPAEGELREDHLLHM